MLNRILRFYNKNKKEIIIVVAIALFIFIIIQTINQAMKYQNEEKLNKIKNTTSSGLEDKIQTDTVIDSTDITEEEAKINLKLIKKFVEYCNEAKIEEAYHLLTQSCKNALFPTIEEFKSKYYGTIFTQKREYLLELWMTDKKGTTYKVEYLEDLLASGGKRENSIVDYITIVEDKINVNTFIKSEERKEEVNKQGINVNITSVDYYTDYQEYTIIVTNNSENNITCYDERNKSSWYLVDDKDSTYSSNISKFTSKELTIGVGEKRNLKVKFYKIYNNKEIKKIVFKNIAINTEPIQLVEIEIKI